MVKKIFISQAMQGKSTEEIKSDRQIIISKLKSRFGDNIEIINTIYDDFSLDTHPLKFLARAIDALADADIIYIPKDWNKSRGCRIEKMCAEEYKVDMFFDFE